MWWLSGGGENGQVLVKVTESRKICPRHLLYSIVPIVNVVLYTRTFAKRVDLMLSVFITINNNI